MLRQLLIVVFVITLCCIVKRVIRHLGIQWLPETEECILVGVFGYLILQHLPHVQLSFDGDMFLRIMVQPIVFEVAVKMNKLAFRRHVTEQQGLVHLVHWRYVIALISVVGTVGYLFQLCR